MTEATQTRTRLAPDSRRAAILEVATAAFAAGDYASVSLAEVSRRSGVTPGLVNHYFGTKRSLYLTVLKEAATQVSTLVRTDLGQLSQQERVERNLNEFLDSVEHDREAWTLLFGARSRRDPEVLELIAEIRAETIDRMARNNVGDAEPAPELLIALRIFQGAAEAAAGEWLSGRAERAQVLELLRLALQALLTTADRPPA